MGGFGVGAEGVGALGVECVLDGIAQRPGRPMWFGTTTEGRAVFALPGNPVSTLVCLSRYVLPALFAAMGVRTQPSERIALATALDWSPPLPRSIPLRVSHHALRRPS